MTNTDNYTYLSVDAIRERATPTGLIPCSRYVPRSGEGLEELVVALCSIFEDAIGEHVTLNEVDYFIGLVVNDHDDVAALIVDHGEAAGWDPTALLDADTIAAARKRC